MRWQTKKYEDGAKRVRTGFLFFPKSCMSNRGLKLETRWLERASWKETLYEGACSRFWLADYWIDQEDL